MTTIKTKKVEKKEVTRRIDPSLIAIEKLTTLNGSLVEQVQELSRELDTLKDRVAQVASRLGL